MFEKQFPKTVTNKHRGARIAKWVFVTLTVLTIARCASQIIADGGWLSHREGQKVRQSE